MDRKTKLSDCDIKQNKDWRSQLKEKKTIQNSERYVGRKREKSCFSEPLLWRDPIARRLVVVAVSMGGSFDEAS